MSVSQIKFDERFIASNTCLTNFEVSRCLKASALENTNNEDLVGQAYEYATEFSHISNVEDLETIKSFCADSLSTYEIVTLCNLIPQSAEAAKVCLSSLERLSDETLEVYLEYINKLVR